MGHRYRDLLRKPGHDLDRFEGYAQPRSHPEHKPFNH